MFFSLYTLVYLIMERNSIENKIILCDNQIFCFMFRTDISPTILSNYIVNLQFYMYYFNYCHEIYPSSLIDNSSFWITNFSDFLHKAAEQEQLNVTARSKLFCWTRSHFEK